jgi:hypothetical protein
MQKVDALTAELSQMATTGSSNDNHTPQMSQRPMQLMNKIPKVLPHECVFAIQIGSEMFKLSGVSASAHKPGISPSHSSPWLQGKVGLCVLMPSLTF